jgi:hypothetical protein
MGVLEDEHVPAPESLHHEGHGLQPSAPRLYEQAAPGNPVSEVIASLALRCSIMLYHIPSPPQIALGFIGLLLTSLPGWSQ